MNVSEHNRGSDVSDPVKSSSASGSKSTSLYLDPEERELVIRASAGTGKTFQLSNRYLTLLRSSAPDRILASTFTRKAAGEIVERILLRLAQAVVDEKAFEELRAFLGTPLLSRSECLARLQQLTRQLHRLRVSTLDGFFARLAGSFSLELRLSPDWRLIDEIEAAQLRDQAIDTVLREGSAQELKTLMHQLDKGDVRRSVHQLIADHIDQFHSIYLQTEASAWNQFNVPTRPTEAEFAALCEQLRDLPITEKRLQKAREADLKKIAQEDWDGLYSSGLMSKVIHGETYYNKEIPEPIRIAYLALHKAIRARWLHIWSQQTQAGYQLLKTFDDHYERLKSESGTLRFDDVTRRLEQFMPAKSFQQFTHRLDGTIDHVLLDEFQDTSVSQWNVMRTVAQDVATDPQKSFFCVGDTKQAIYGWRGGEAAIFEAMQQQFPGVHERSLNESFRSSPVIMDVVNRLFGNIDQHNGFDELNGVLRAWATEFPEHQTARRELPGYCCLQTSSLPVTDDTTSLNTEALDRELFQYVARQVQQLHTQHPAGTIGILTRSNAAIGKLIFELNRVGVTASEEGGNPLTDSTAVLLMLSLLQLIDHPGDTIARFHVATSPLGSLLEYKNHQDDSIAEQFAQRLRLQLFQQGFGAFVQHCATLLEPSCDASEFRRLRQLGTLAEQYDAIAPAVRTQEFIEFVERQRVHEPSDARVRVMTIHQSKGLQFDTVILCECDRPLTKPPQMLTWIPEPGAPPAAVALSRSQQLRDLFPEKLLQAWQQTHARALNEALCLLYVAVTRAVSGLHIIIRPRLAKSAEKQPPKTFAGLLRAALADGAAPDPETVLFAHGDPDWFRSIPSKPAPANSSNVATIPRQIRFVEHKSRRRLPRVTPSQHRSAHDVRLRDVLHVGPTPARQRGTLIHAWMEQIEWLDDGLPSEESLKTLGHQQGVDDSVIQDCLREFQRMLNRPQVRELLSRQSSLQATSLAVSAECKADILAAPVEIQVDNELPFSVIREGALMSGTIDRLVRITRGDLTLAAEIIDFKTDSLLNDVVAINERVAYYRSQLQSYIDAIQQIEQLAPDQISAKLVMLQLGKVIVVDNTDRST